MQKNHSRQSSIEFNISEEQALINDILTLENQTGVGQKRRLMGRDRKICDEKTKKTVEGIYGNSGKIQGKERGMANMEFKKKKIRDQSKPSYTCEDVSNNWKIVSNAIVKTQSKIKNPEKIQKIQRQGEIKAEVGKIKSKQCVSTTHKIPKLKNQLHKKLNLFDEGENKRVAITKLYSSTINANKQKCLTQSELNRQKILYLNTFTIFHYQKNSSPSSQSLLFQHQPKSSDEHTHQQINASKPQYKYKYRSQLHFHNYDYNPTQYLLIQIQDQNLTIWIGKITNKCQYKLLRKIYLSTSTGNSSQYQGQNQCQYSSKNQGIKVTTICYVPVVMNQNDYVNDNNNNKQQCKNSQKSTNNKYQNNIILEQDRYAGDKLLIGCQNGAVYVIEKLSQIIQNQNQRQRQSQNQNEEQLRSNDTIIDENNVIIPNYFNDNKENIGMNGSLLKSKIFQNNQVSFIIKDFNRLKRIYIIIGGNKIFTYDYQRRRQHFQPQLNKYSQIIRTILPQTPHIYHYNLIQVSPEQSSQKLQQNPKILFIKSIKLNSKVNKNSNININIKNNGKDNLNKNNNNGILIFLQNMRIPCILSQQQIQIWFPSKLNQFLKIFNRFWDNLHYNQYLQSVHQKYDKNQLKYDRNIVQKQYNDKIKEKNDRISVIEYNLEANQVIIGYLDGVIQFYSVVTTNNFLNSNDTQYQSTNPIFNNFNSQSQSQQQQSGTFPSFSFQTKPITSSSSLLISSQKQKYQTFTFTYTLHKHFIIKQDNCITSLSTHRIQSYICIATDMKILFYDIQYRNKFSQSLKQKNINAINIVKWTVGSCLLLCSVSGFKYKEKEKVNCDKLFKQKKESKLGLTQSKITTNQSDKTHSILKTQIDIEPKNLLINNDKQAIKAPNKNKVKEDKVYLYSKEIPIRVKS